MKANELRIGNYYSCASNEGIIYPKVKAIQYNEFGFLSDIDGTNFEICKPIQITEQWLLWFGFEKSKEQIHEYDYFKGRYSIFRNSLNEFNFNFLNPGDWYMEIKYIHQLQNLYFALTGEELTVK
jgi:hypothetical protein